jgi:hypothetical protein
MPSFPPPYNPSLFLSSGTYCLDITIVSPLKSNASKRPDKEGLILLILAILSIIDLDALKK